MHPDCWKTAGLHSHHLIKRSDGGLDTVGNLITLCYVCHQRCHEGHGKGAERLTALDFQIDMLIRLQERLPKRQFRWDGVLETMKRKAALRATEPTE